jgi:molecular chaperone GrpE
MQPNEQPQNSGEEQKDQKEKEMEHPVENDTPGEEDVEEKNPECVSTEAKNKEEEKKVEPNYRELIEKMSDEDIKLLFGQAAQSIFYLESLKRVKADYDNYEKRMEREQANIYKYANQNLLKKLIELLDILEKALCVSPQTIEKNFWDGIVLFHKEFLKILQEFHVSTIEAVGKRFDPTYHEAMLQQETEKYPEFTVMQEFQKGYTFQDRILRPSKVVISRKVAPKQEEKKANGSEPKPQ